MTARPRRRRPILPLLAAAPIVLAFLAGGCSETESIGDYVDDVVAYIEDDEEIFGDDVPGADEPYRSLDEVPSEAPSVSSPEERVEVTRGLVADREKALHTAEELRARIEPAGPTADEAEGGSNDDGQVRTVYSPAEEPADPAPPGDE